MVKVPVWMQFHPALGLELLLHVHFKASFIWSSESISTGAQFMALHWKMLDEVQ